MAQPCLETKTFLGVFQIGNIIVCSWNQQPIFFSDAVRFVACFLYRYSTNIFFQDDLEIVVASGLMKIAISNENILVIRFPHPFF